MNLTVALEGEKQKRHSCLFLTCRHPDLLQSLELLQPYVFIAKYVRHLHTNIDVDSIDPSQLIARRVG